MARPATFSKRDNEKKKQTKREEKQKRKEDRKLNGKSGSLDDMIAYVDENGMLTSTPPDVSKKKEKINQDDIMVSVPKKEKEEPVVYKGRVEHFNESKGYGFIKDLAGTDKYFFHISNAPAEVEEGNIVLFDLERGKRGLNAVNIVFEK